jgi:hypothetical protein
MIKFIIIKFKIQLIILYIEIDILNKMNIQT